MNTPTHSGQHGMIKNMLKRHIPVIGMIAVSWLLASFMLTTGHGWGDDFSCYIMQAKSLVNGHINEFWARNSLTIARSVPGLGPTAYPWGFPLLLAPIYYFFGVHLLALKCVNFVFFALFFLVFFALLKRRVTPIESAFLTLVFAVHPAFLSAHDYILSDIPFLCFSTFAILILDKHILSQPYARWSGWGFGLVAFMAFEVRSNGILFLPLLFVCQFIGFFRTKTTRDKSKNDYIASALVPYGVFFAAWFLCSRLLPEGQSSYLQQIDGRIILSNARYYLIEVFASFFSALPGGKFVYALLLFFCLIGVIRTFRKEYHFGVYTGLTLSLLLLWPAREGIRLLFPILPFLLYFTFQGMKFTGERLAYLLHCPQSRFLSHIVWMCMSVMFLHATFQRIQINLRNHREIEGPFDASSAAMFTMISTHTEHTSTIGFFKPRVFRMLSDRDAFTLVSCSQLPQADYVVLHNRMDDYKQIAPAQIRRCPLTGIDLGLAYENRTFTVYKIEKPEKQAGR